MTIAYLLQDLQSIEPWRYLWSFGLGAALGYFYFGGLWWTVRRLQTAKLPGLLFFLSFFVRTVITVTVLFAGTGGRWPLILTSVGAFLLVRLQLTRRWGPGQGPESGSEPGAGLGGHCHAA